MNGLLLNVAPTGRVVVVCLGALEPELAGDADPSRGAAWLRNARHLLDHARAHAWPVAHVFSARQHGRMSRWTSAPGLGPLPAEPVFYRQSSSAFSCRAFKAFADLHRNDTLLLSGASLDACCLATAVNGVHAGRSMVVVEDAMLASEGEWNGLAGLLDISSRCGFGSLRFDVHSRFTGDSPQFLVIRGGRT
jgi:nicotinamidase-related amidase